MNPTKEHQKEIDMSQPNQIADSIREQVAKYPTVDGIAEAVALGLIRDIRSGSGGYLTDAVKLSKIGDVLAALDIVSAA